MPDNTDIDNAIEILDNIKRKVGTYEFEQVLEVIDVLEQCREEQNEQS